MKDNIKLLLMYAFCSNLIVNSGYSMDYLRCSNAIFAPQININQQDNVFLTNVNNQIDLDFEITRNHKNWFSYYMNDIRKINKIYRIFSESPEIIKQQYKHINRVLEKQEKFLQQLDESIINLNKYDITTDKIISAFLNKNQLKEFYNRFEITKNFYKYKGIGAFFNKKEKLSEESSGDESTLSTYNTNNNNISISNVNQNLLNIHQNKNERLTQQLQIVRTGQIKIIANKIQRVCELSLNGVKKAENIVDNNRNEIQINGNKIQANNKQNNIISIHNNLKKQKQELFSLLYKENKNKQDWKNKNAQKDYIALQIKYNEMINKNDAELNKNKKEIKKLKRQLNNKDVIFNNARNGYIALQTKYNEIINKNDAELNKNKKEIKKLNNLLTKNAVMADQAQKDLWKQGLKIYNLNKELNEYKEELGKKKEFQNNEIIKKVNELNINGTKRPAPIITQVNKITLKANTNKKQENVINKVKNINIIGSTEKYNKLQQEIKNIQKEKIGLENEVGRFEIENNSLRDESNKNKELNEGLKKKLEETQNKLKQLEGKTDIYNKAKHKQGQMSSKNDKLSKENTALQNKIKELKEESKKLQEQLQNKNEELNEYKKEYEKLKSEKNNIEENEKKLQDLLQKNAAIAEQNQIEQQNIFIEKLKLERVSQKLSARINEMEKENESLLKRIEQLTENNEQNQIRIRQLEGNNRLFGNLKNIFHFKNKK